MSKANCSLQAEVLTSFERACREQDFELADLLLTFLQGIARQRGDDELLTLAYGIFAKECRPLEGHGK
jgi:hypothetical protein